MILSTAGPDGIDASPRGDNDEVVRINGEAIVTADDDINGVFGRRASLLGVFALLIQRHVPHIVRPKDL